MFTFIICLRTRSGQGSLGFAFFDVWARCKRNRTNIVALPVCLYYCVRVALIVVVSILVNDCFCWYLLKCFYHCVTIVSIIVFNEVLLSLFYYFDVMLL